ncbi:MAG TPA: hypothetical protein VHQ95_17185 [Pyrinomonadaceae bacterium]|nr:hypothetical protein [Pyrinomonadaceae bacterium]
MGEIVPGEVLADSQVHRLADLRLGLLRLHKALLEMERINYEKVSGRVNSGELLQMVVNHPQFGWLRIISALVVEIDEILNDEDPVNVSDFAELTSQARRLLTAPENEEFKTKYQAALQHEPAVVMAHANVMQLLR